MGSAILLVLLLICSWREWPRVMRHYIQNWEVSDSNSARFLAGLWDPTLLQGNRWPLNQNKSIAVININLVKLQTWPYGSQIAVKKNSYTNWSTRFISPKLCVGFSIFHVQQKAWTLWLQIAIIPFKIKIIKPHTVFPPDLWFLSCNKKFKYSMISVWIGAPQKLSWRWTFQTWKFKVLSISLFLNSNF